MPRGVRTDRISQRDLEVLEFIARYGVVPRQAVAIWAGTGRAVTQARERRQRLAGLVELRPRLGSLGPFCLATRTGIRACGRSNLRPARFSFGEASHQAHCALLGARLERAGERVLSEREIMAHERLEQKHLYSAELPRGGHHRADLIRLAPEGPVAIEVELTPKGAARLDLLLRSWRRAVAGRKIRSVLYRCSPEALGAVRRSAIRISASETIAIEPLDAPGVLGSSR